MRINSLLVSMALLANMHVIANNYTIADTSGNNMLTQKEMQEGWRLLFNGKTLDGWRTYKNQPGSWKVNENALCSERSEGSSHADLITDNEFENFELSIDWKISPKGNSGIMYLVTESYDNAFESGPEYQLIDDDGFPEHIEDYQKTSANYAMQPPAIKAANAPGEWNHTVIIVNKGHVEHWLNGKKVVEYNLGSDEWKKQKAAGKWKDEAGYGASTKGHIALQSAHSNVDDTYICFRNIKIKLL
jgi:3-keto-disaccharide hydrolase